MTFHLLSLKSFVCNGVAVWSSQGLGRGAGDNVHEAPDVGPAPRNASQVSVAIPVSGRRPPRSTISQDGGLPARPPPPAADQGVTRNGLACAEHDRSCRSCVRYFIRVSREPSNVGTPCPCPVETETDKQSSLPRRHRGPQAEPFHPASSTESGDLPPPPPRSPALSGAPPLSFKSAFTDFFLLEIHAHSSREVEKMRKSRKNITAIHGPNPQR